MSYRNLEIWLLARMVAVDIHKMTLSSLPKFEMHEEGAQIRRSSKSIRSNIVEGYGRRRYKQDYLRFICYALASCDETTDHLESLFETGSLTDETLYKKVHSDLLTLGKQINCFLQSVESGHRSLREEEAPYDINTQDTPDQ